MGEKELEKKGFSQLVGGSVLKKNEVSKRSRRGETRRTSSRRQGLRREKRGTKRTGTVSSSGGFSGVEKKEMKRTGFERRHLLDS